MHIHRAAIDLHSINTCAAQSDRAIAAQRSAEVRKRLLNRAQSIAADASPEESLFLGHWLDYRNCQPLPNDEYHPSSHREDPYFI